MKKQTRPMPIIWEFAGLRLGVRAYRAVTSVLVSRGFAKEETEPPFTVTPIIPASEFARKLCLKDFGQIRECGKKTIREIASQMRRYCPGKRWDVVSSYSRRERLVRNCPNCGCQIKMTFNWKTA